MGVGPSGRRATVILAVAAVLAGAGWLATSGTARMAPVLDRQWTPSDLAEAQKALTSRGIDNRVDSGRLVVPPSRVLEARGVVQAEGLGEGGQPDALEQLAQKEDIWSSQSQITKRWQAAKMAAMARLIRRFPPVRSATVVFEEGASGGLGGGGISPTACVGVELKSGCAMTDEIVEAIADLVAGGVAGMKRQDVRIVDNSGRSYRAEETFAGASPALRQVRAAEDYLTKKVRAAIPPIDGTVVSVRAEPAASPPVGANEAGTLPRCAEARVSVPRSYFVGVARVSTGQKQPDDAAVQAAIAAGLDQMRDMVTSALGEKDASRIRVDWHYDDSPVREVAAALGPSPTDSWRQWRVPAVGGAIAGAILWALAGGLLRRRRGGGAGASAQAEPGADSSRGVLGLLQWASVEDISALAQGEHPQTVAVLLSALPADRAGAVLAALTPETQKEVARRIVALGKIEPEMLREVDRALAGRIGELPAAQRPARLVESGVGLQSAVATGGTAKLADLLHRAGRPTETRVLQSLSQGLPGLVESLRARTLSFEDIAALSESRLGSVLEGMDSRRLAVALRTASKPLAQKIYSCLSAPAARRLRGQVDQVGPVRLSEVEAAQQQIVAELAAEDVGQYAAAGAADQVA
jgi:flagellar motor switch protein FliG/type III secretory pathway lipoprotein EscJ